MRRVSRAGARCKMKWLGKKSGVIKQTFDREEMTGEKQAHSSHLSLESV